MPQQCWAPAFNFPSPPSNFHPSWEGLNFLLFPPSFPQTLCCNHTELLTIPWHSMSHCYVCIWSLCLKGSFYQSVFSIRQIYSYQLIPKWNVTSVKHDAIGCCLLVSHNVLSSVVTSVPLLCSVNLYLLSGLDWSRWGNRPPFIISVSLVSLIGVSSQ